MTKDERYITRCFDLARWGAGSVSPNPMVGAVLVYNDRIIGEGLHERYGEAHAEVNALRSVKPESQHLISQATLYVSLEPCTIFGRTPPCTKLILEQKIPKVVISCLDQTPEVAGKGVEKLRANGVEVVTGILEKQGKELSRYRNHFVTCERPYVILKFAQTLNGKFSTPGEQTWISNAYAQRLVHKWRNEADAILVGTHTALIDNPQLTNRLYFGKSPLRIILDRNLRLPENLHIFDENYATLIITERSDLEIENRRKSKIEYLSLDFNPELLPNLLKKLHERKIMTLLVEGGARLLKSLIEQGLWDESRVLVGNQTLEVGLDAPQIPGVRIGQYPLADNQIIRYQNVHNR